MSTDSLQRFLDAQERDYEIAFTELRQGKKRSHWMWYVFPQIQGLGFSETSRFYAIRDSAEAKAFLKHSILGTRLVQICKALIALPSKDAHGIFGSPDDRKLQSSMTLFASLDSHPVFQQVLDKFYKGIKDERTLQILGQ